MQAAPTLPCATDLRVAGPVSRSFRSRRRILGWRREGEAHDLLKTQVTPESVDPRVDEDQGALVIPGFGCVAE